jgi:hypothetical protein
MSFVNTLPYISNPIEEFKDFKFVSWEREIYPQFKGAVKQEEIDFFANLIASHNLSRVLDFGVGGGTELSGIIENLEKHGRTLETAEANEIDENFIDLASRLFKKKKQNVLMHRANWLDLPLATPSYSGLFDFGYLTGNSLTYIGGGTREYTKKAQQSIVSKFAQLIKKGGYLFIDSRNYDYIKSLMHLPKDKIFENFYFDYTVYYHGFQETVTVFPAYISDTVVVLHYYDKINRKWSKLDLYPIYQKDMLEILSRDFVIEQVYHDFEKVDEKSGRKKSLFVQFLARKK